MLGIKFHLFFLQKGYIDEFFKLYMFMKFYPCENVCLNTLSFQFNSKFIGKLVWSQYHKLIVFSSLRFGSFQILRFFLTHECAKCISKHNTCIKLMVSYQQCQLLCFQFLTQVWVLINHLETQVHDHKLRLLLCQNFTLV